MSITSSLFAGISGLNALGNAMTVIGDNIANVNTIGFKGSRVTFQDVLSQTVGTASGTTQVGRGTAMADISSSFAQGSFESTESATDLAIGGAGFFMVRDPDNENSEYFTRSGEFRFDQDGNFVNPGGYIVQGYALNETTGENEGRVADIALPGFKSAPSETDKLTSIMNLDSSSDNNSNIPADNTALSVAWDGSNVDGEYIADDAYEYQTSLKVYDSLGKTHDISIYFDKGVSATANPVWEYIVTCHPGEDARSGATGANLGLLARGTIEFNGTTGQLSGADSTITIRLNTGSGWAAADLTNADAIASGGYFAVTPQFDGTPTAMSIKLDFGARYNGTTAWANDTSSTTQYSASSTTNSQTATGYGAGDLNSITVGTDGVITGQYSNGQVIPLYRVELFKFNNEQGLYKVGGNLFSETRLSGEKIPGNPGENGLGSISPNSLEQSNTDLATEFVRMITTQRGFQANSKVITTVDQMLADLINLKR